MFCKILFVVKYLYPILVLLLMIFFDNYSLQTFLETSTVTEQKWMLQEFTVWWLLAQVSQKNLSNCLAEFFILKIIFLLNPKTI